MLYSPAGAVGEQNGYRQFLMQITIADALSHAYALPTFLVDGTPMPVNCMLVLQCTQNFNYDLGLSSGAINSTTNPGIAVNAQSGFWQEWTRRNANAFNPQTHLLVQAAAAGTMNVFIVRTNACIPPPGGLP